MTQKAKGEFMGMAYYAANLESSFLAGTPRIKRARQWAKVAKIIALSPWFVTVGALSIAAALLLLIFAMPLKAIAYLVKFAIYGHARW